MIVIWFTFLDRLRWTFYPTLTHPQLVKSGDCETTSTNTGKSWSGIEEFRVTSEGKEEVISSLVEILCAPCQHPCVPETQMLNSCLRGAGYPFTARCRSFVLHVHHTKLAHCPHSASERMSCISPELFLFTDKRGVQITTTAEDLTSLPNVDGMTKLVLHTAIFSC